MVCLSRRSLFRSCHMVVCLAVAWGCSNARSADSPWLYGIHWYGDAANSQVETMTGGKGIWSLEIVQLAGDFWWGPEWQRDNRFNAMVSRGHTIICRVERNWGETVPFVGNETEYLADLQAAAVALADTVHIWQIGNEMNIFGEWGGQVLPPAHYVDIYKQARAAIKSVPSSLGEQIVLLGPVSPGEIAGGARHTDGNIYLAEMCALLGPDEVDGFSLHSYAAPWHTADTARQEYLAGWVAQLAILETYGFRNKPAYITEWNRRADPLTDYNEAQSAQFLQVAYLDLHDWNQTVGSHPIGTMCWFIYQYDDQTWKNYSLEYLKTVGPSGPDNDPWDAMQYVCTLDLPTAAPDPGAVSMFVDGVPPGTNIAPEAAGIVASSGANAAAAIDGVVSTSSQWLSDPTVPPHWLQLDLGQARLVTGYQLHCAQAAGSQQRFNIEAIGIEVAPTASGPWTRHGLAYNVGEAASFARTYTTPQLAQHIRITIYDAGYDNNARVPELEIYAEVVAGDYDLDGDVDAGDAVVMMFCLNGPDNAYLDGHFCRNGDLDEDGDLDLADVAGYQVLMVE
jgi:hypothetical protein